MFLQMPLIESNSSQSLNNNLRAIPERKAVSKFYRVGCNLFKNFFSSIAVQTNEQFFATIETNYQHNGDKKILMCPQNTYATVVYDFYHLGPFERYCTDFHSIRHNDQRSEPFEHRWNVHKVNAISKWFNVFEQVMKAIVYFTTDSFIDR